MSIQKIQAQIVAEVDDQSMKKAGDQINSYARDTGKKLDKSFLFKLQLDKAETKIQLDEARKLLSQAKKAGDKELTLKMTLKTSELQDKLSESTRRLRNFKNTGDETSSRLSRLFGSSGLGGVIGKLASKFSVLALALGAVRIATKAITLGDKLEQATLSFETLLGSATKAKILLEDLTTFAQKTPFELIGLRETAKQLLAYGIESENIIPTLKSLGDVASGVGKPIEQIALAYGQVRTANQLYGTELRQFTQAGIPLMAELAKQFGVTEAEVKKMVENGEVGFKDVQDAFVNMTSEGGLFFDNMAKKSGTLTGKWSNLQDQANSMLESVGTALIPASKKVVDGLSYLLVKSREVFLGLRVLWSQLVGGITQGVLDMNIDFIRMMTSLSISINKVKVFFVGLGLAIQKTYIKMNTGLAVMVSKGIGKFKLLGDNIGIFKRNVGKTFDNLPGSMQAGLNKGIEKIEKFINFASDGVNKFAKKLGFEGDLVKGITLGRFDDGGFSESLEEFKEYSEEKDNAIANSADIEMKALEATNLAWRQSLTDKTNARIKSDNSEVASILELKKAHQKGLDDTLNSFVQSDLEKRELDTEFTDSTIDNNNDITDNAVGNSEKISEAEEAQMEQREKYLKFLEQKATEREEREKDRIKALEDSKKLIKDFYGEVRDQIEDSEEKIEDFNDKIKESKEKIKELKQELQDEKLDVGIGLQERKTDIKSEMKELESEYSGIKSTSRLSEGSLTGIGEGNLGGGLTGNTALEYKKLKEELAIIDKNSRLITEEAKDIASESDSERLIREYNEKRDKIKLEIEDERNKIDELKTLKQEEKEIYQGVDDYRTALEKNYTKLLSEEVTERISMLEEMRIKAVQTANAIASATGDYYKSTNNNNVSVNLNGTGYASVDAKTIGDTLVSQINNSNKGINN